MTALVAVRYPIHPSIWEEDATWRPVSAQLVTGFRWDTPRHCEGQIIQTSYSTGKRPSDGEAGSTDAYCREIDRSIPQTQYFARVFRSPDLSSAASAMLASMHDAERRYAADSTTDQRRRAGRDHWTRRELAALGELVGHMLVKMGTTPAVTRDGVDILTHGARADIGELDATQQEVLF